MNAAIREQAIRNIINIWYVDGTGTRTDRAFDYNTLMTEVQNLLPLGRASRWKNAINAWINLLNEAHTEFCKEEWFSTDEGFYKYTDLTPTCQATYNTWFTYALHQGSVFAWYEYK